MPDSTMYSSILTFWFDETSPAQWWKVDPGFDQLIRSRFSEVHAMASRCECYGWRREPKGRLAEIIVLDQFSRNMHRGTPLAFACDPLALALSQEAVALDVGRLLSPDELAFLYMPYMHSESGAIHEVALQLFKAAGLQANIEFELRHKSIIDRFGRYPHRNATLGRSSTDEELAFLARPGSSF